jgi:lipopolysaccharide/colanic/teichoic acid biosynthesis glycosyltransferase
MIRVVDLVLSFLGLILLSPLFLLIAIFIAADSKGGIFFLQKRVGKGNLDFKLFKFRTMRGDAERGGSLTIGTNDKRITRTGLLLRKYKLDELPQLINVLAGDMSMVGPRPEVRKYVELYSEEQRKVLVVKPGITDYASIEYMNENELLERSRDPEKTYIEQVMPAKLELNLKYLQNPGLKNYFIIIGKTIAGVFFIRQRRKDAKE